MRAMVTIAALLLWSALTGAQVEIRSLTGTLGGHEVGGVTIDMIGRVYADRFWRHRVEADSGRSAHHVQRGSQSTGRRAVSM